MVASRSLGAPGKMGQASPLWIAVDSGGNFYSAIRDSISFNGSAPGFWPCPFSTIC